MFNSRMMQQTGGYLFHCPLIRSMLSFPNPSILRVRANSSNMLSLELNHIARYSHGHSYSHNNSYSLNTKSGKNVTRNSSLNHMIRHVINNLIVGKYDVAKNIVAKNAIDINSHDMWEHTPLIDAVQRGDVKSINFLVKQMGANIHVACKWPDYKTALHYAAESGYYDVTETLLRLGAYVNSVDAHKRTPLDLTSDDKIKKLLQTHQGFKGEVLYYRHNGYTNHNHSNGFADQMTENSTNSMHEGRMPTV